MRTTNFISTIIGAIFATSFSLFPVNALADLNDGLIGHYPFDGNTLDHSSFANDAGVNGATLTTDRNGNPDSAYAFDGVDDYLLIPHISELNIPIDGFAISFFIKLHPDQIGGTYSLFDKFNRYDCFGLISGWNLQHGITGAHISYAYGTGSQYVDIPGAAILDDQWHHVLAMVSDGQFSFYVDGQLYSSQVLLGAPLGNSAPLYIGKWACNNSRYFHGSLDDIRLYRRALTDAEIASLNDPGSMEPPVDPEPEVDPSILRPAANTDLVIQSVLIDPVTGEVTIKAALDSSSSAWSEINANPDIRFTVEVRSNDTVSTSGVIGDSSIQLSTDQLNRLHYGDVEVKACDVDHKDGHSHKHRKHDKHDKHHHDSKGKKQDANAWWEQQIERIRQQN